MTSVFASLVSIGALVAPVIAYTPEGNVEPPTSHMRFPGTITIPDATFERLLEAAARSFEMDRGPNKRSMDSLVDDLVWRHDVGH